MLRLSLCKRTFFIIPYPFKKGGGKVLTMLYTMLSPVYGVSILGVLLNRLALNPLVYRVPESKEDLSHTLVSPLTTLYHTHCFISRKKTLECFTIAIRLWSPNGLFFLGFSIPTYSKKKSKINSIILLWKVIKYGKTIFYY